MLGTHAILYLNPEYVSICKKIALHQHNINEHVDIGITDAQKYYKVYTFDQPFFYQTSSNGTDEQLTSYPSYEVLQPHRTYWKPTSLY